MKTNRVVWIGPGTVPAERWWVSAARDEAATGSDHNSPMLRLLAHRVRHRLKRDGFKARPIPYLLAGPESDESKRVG